MAIEFLKDAFVDYENYSIDVIEYRQGGFCLVSYGVKGALMAYGFDKTTGDFDEIECTHIDDYYVSRMEFLTNIHDNLELIENEV